MGVRICAKVICLALCAGLMGAPAAMGALNSYVLDLDGNGDYVSAYDNDNLTNFTDGSFTIQAWIYLQQLSINQPIVSKYVETGDQRSWAFLVTSTGQLRAYISSDGTADNTTMWQTNTQVVYADTWHHVAFVCNPGGVDKIEFYVDNVEYAHSNSSVDPPSSPYNSTAEMWVGRFINQYYYGYIDELRITDGALSSFPSSVMDLPLSPTVDTEVLYHFDESSGDVIDHSNLFGNPTNTGYLQGNAYRRAWDGLGPGNDLPLPVTLVSMSAMGENALVKINWTTETEINNLGFNLYRSLNESTGYTRINSDLIPSQGYTVATQTYEYTDTRDVVNGLTYYYKISDVDVNGRERTHSVIASATPLLEPLLPGDDTNLAGYRLSQNYPNPFNSTTTIRYYVRDGGMVRLSVYNLNGEEVALLVNENKPMGEYLYKFDASAFPTGIYFVRLLGENGYDNIKKMLFLK